MNVYRVWDDEFNLTEGKAVEIVAATPREAAETYALIMWREEGDFTSLEVHLRDKAGAHLVSKVEIEMDPYVYSMPVREVKE